MNITEYQGSPTSATSTVPAALAVLTRQHCNGHHRIDYGMHYATKSGNIWWKSLAAMLQYGENLHHVDVGFNSRRIQENCLER